jgi:hypothetical protein
MLTVLTQSIELHPVEKEPRSKFTANASGYLFRAPLRWSAPVGQKSAWGYLGPLRSHKARW